MNLCVHSRKKLKYYLFRQFSTGTISPGSVTRKKKSNLKSNLQCSWNEHPLAELQQADSLLVNVILYGFHFWLVFRLKTHHKTILTKWNATHLWFTHKHIMFSTISQTKQKQSLKIIFKIANFYPNHLVTSKVKLRSGKLLLSTACSAADLQHSLEQHSGKSGESQSIYQWCKTKSSLANGSFHCILEFQTSIVKNIVSFQSVLDLCTKMVVQNFTTDEDVYHHILGSGDKSDKESELGEVGDSEVGWDDNGSDGPGESVEGLNEPSALSGRGVVMGEKCNVVALAVIVLDMFHRNWSHSCT